MSFLSSIQMHFSHSEMCCRGLNKLRSPVGWGERGLDEQGCAVVSVLVRQHSEWDRELEGAGQDDFGSVTPRSPL